MQKKVTTWGVCREYFITHPKVLRSQFLEHMRQANTSRSRVRTADSVYRTALCRAGYLKIVYHGMYVRVKSIPKDLTYTQLIKQAYGR